MKNQFSKFLIVVLALSLTACSQKSLTKVSDGIFNAIFSTRPQIADTSFVLIKLSQEPLLTTLKTADGKQTVDPDQLKAINDEQEKLISDLQKLSSDIKVLYRYKMVLNGVAVATPTNLLEKLRGISNVINVEVSGSFDRPSDASDDETTVWKNLKDHNSVKFIGAEAAHELGITGKGLRIGIIDTGIDYTHIMLGGAGTPEAYKAIDPSQASSAFPTAKVVGGSDLVGTDYDSASADYKKRIPKPDANPIDEAGHGSHVAGTIAGRGDGVNSYDGVAPDAQLYAIKVFGKEGSTGDPVVIDALEYAADPNGDGDPSDHLDVVNLSLGSGYGEAHVLYTEAIQNLVAGGTSVVASAGNEGDTAYVVGSPSVADDALSVAASVDDMDHNWKFKAVLFSTPDQPEIYTEAVEASIAKPIDQAGDIQGDLVYVGLADQDFDSTVKAQVAGKVAFIDRGVVTFAEKIRRAAEAGAVGVVVANNQPGPAMQMGGDGEYAIPAIMITQELGTQLKAQQQKGTVAIHFKTDRMIEKPELIDTMAGFSSKGPRSLDALVKPEIAAPGAAVVSAKMGSGSESVMMSGTSMAAPHMTGVIALLKQAHPDLSARELKALAVGTAKSMVDENKIPYPVSRQGAGRVQVINALDAKLISDPVALSLGELTIERSKTLRKDLTIKNITSNEVDVSVAFDGNSAITMTGPSSLKLAAGQSQVLSLKFTVNTSSLKNSSDELDGLLKLSDSNGEVLRVPALAIVNRLAQVKVDSLNVASTSESDSAGAVAQVAISNVGVNTGDAYLLNLIARDDRKNDSTQDQFRSKACDLESASYRVITRDGVEYLQVAAKLYEPMTTWDNCEISVLIDSDKDGVADQELVGARQDHLKGLTKKDYTSILLDAAKARQLRKDFEQKVANNQAKTEDENYTDAVVDLEQFTALDHSTIAIVEAPVSQLKLAGNGELQVKIAASYQEESAIEADDYLNNKWYGLNVKPGSQGYVDLPEKITLSAGELKSVEVTKGNGSEKLIALFPNNRVVTGSVGDDDQSQVVKASYGQAISKAR